MRCRFLAPDGKRIKREHGVAYPSGTETVAAPATVSGECIPAWPLASFAGKAGMHGDPRARRPAGAIRAKSPNFYVRTEGVT